MSARGDGDGDAVGLELALLCESAEVSESGRPTLVGAFSRVGAHELPAALPARVLALELWGRPYSRARFALRFVGPSFATPVTSPPQEVEIERHGFVSFGAQLAGISLTAAGEHRIDVLDEGGARLGGVRFMVTLMPRD